jgi:hypothetical protein
LKFVLAFCLLVLSHRSLARAQQSFFTRERKLETGLYAGAIVVDSISTQIAVRRGNFNEYNPLARPFVYHGELRQSAGSLLGFAAGIVPAVLLDHANHHAAALSWLHLFAAGESANSARMAYLYH